MHGAQAKPVIYINHHWTPMSPQHPTATEIHQSSRDIIKLASRIYFSVLQQWEETMVPLIVHMVPVKANIIVQRCFVSACMILIDYYSTHTYICNPFRFFGLIFKCGHNGKSKSWDGSVLLPIGRSLDLPDVDPQLWRASDQWPWVQLMILNCNTPNLLVYVQGSSTRYDKIVWFSNRTPLLLQQVSIYGHPARTYWPQEAHAPCCQLHHAQEMSNESMWR